MATIKKKDLKNYKTSTKKVGLDELIDADGSPIEGDRNPVNNSEIETAPQATSDDHAALAIQPNRYYYGVGGTAYSHGARVQAESELTEAEIAERKMATMLEDLISKSNDNDMVQKFSDVDVNRNGIPDLQDLITTHHKQVVVKKAEDLIKTIHSNSLNGEQVGILLNYLLANMDLKKIPSDYKQVIKKTFNG
jgi:hypothetical protein